MNNDMGFDEGQGIVKLDVDAAARGMVVDDPVDFGDSGPGELPFSVKGAPGWETVPELEDESEAVSEHELDTCMLEQLDPEFFRAADALAAQRESTDAPQTEFEARLQAACESIGTNDAVDQQSGGLAAELRAARELIELREAELSEREARIASLTLECAGLRDQLRDRPRGQGADGDAPAVVAGNLESIASHRRPDLVARLRQRLDETARALTIAREQIEALSRERDELRQTPREAASSTPGSADERPGLLGRLLGLFKQTAERSTVAAPVVAPVIEEEQAPDIAADAAFAGEPGTEVPTVVVDPASAAAEPEVPSAVATRRQDESTAPVLHRYLIGAGQDSGEVHELSQPRMYVGRGCEAHLRIPDATVSRLHAVISQGHGATIVEDASSTNGVFINGQRARRAVLNDGDNVTFGTVHFLYRVGPGAI